MAGAYGRIQIHSMARPRQSPPPIKSVRERLGALRHVGPLFLLVWGTSAPLTIATIGIRLIRSLLPVSTLYVGKLIIDEVIRTAALPGHPDTWNGWVASGLLDRTMQLIVLEFALAIGADLLSRGCPLDFHASVFAAGQVAQSHISRANATILCKQAGSHYEVTVRRSFADYLFRWLCAAAGA